MPGKENQKLKLLGRVKPAVVAGLLKTQVATSANQAWFFVDYASGDYPLHTSFDILIETAGKDWSYTTKTELIQITDQFGRALKEIPVGWKTICLLGFSPKIPDVVKNMPMFETWGTNENSILISRKEDIDLSTPQVIQNEDFKTLSYFIKRSLLRRKRRQSVFHTSDIATYIHTTNPRYVAYIINNLILSGVLKEKKTDEFELVEPA